MHIKFTKIIILFAIFFSINLYAGFTIKRINKAPVIDGNLSEACWDMDKAFSLKHYKNKTLLNKTLVSLVWDKKYLYIAFKCFEKNIAGMTTNLMHDEERDLTTIFQDDCVEVFLDTLSSKKDFYHIAINSWGVIYDAKINNNVRNTTWASNINVAVKKYKSYWAVELAIPFTDFEYIPKGGEIWGVNLCREQKSNKELSCLSPTFGRFDAPNKFASAKFQTKDKKLGFSISSFAFKGNDRIKIKFVNKKSSSQQVQCIIGKSTKKINLPPKKTSNVILDYKTVLGMNNIRLAILNITANKKLYYNKLSILKINPSTMDLGRTWKIKDPLYRELFSKKDTGFGKEGAISWFLGRNYKKMRPFAKQYGLRYVYSEEYKRLTKEKMFTFTNNSVFAGSLSKHYDTVNQDRKAGHKEILMPYRPDVLKKSGNIEKYLMVLKETLKKYPDALWGVAAGDEFHHGIAKQLLKQFHQKQPSEYILAIDREVKEKYGAGKFGIPLSKSDENPYRWIAYHKWLSAKLTTMLELMYKTVKKNNPEIKVISYDPYSFHRPIDFSAWKGKCDILLHQTYPKNTSKRADVGFIVKLISDISGIEEVWPCMHIENYAGNYTPKEVLELCSQAFRNGATGFHWYPQDVTGKRSKIGYMHNEYYGAPERWQLVVNLTNEIAKMKKLAFPSPDCAILYSCDTQSSVPGGKVTNDAEAAYTLLGPVVGGAFKFIDDNQIERNNVDLKKFKAIYISSAKIERKIVIDKLVQYVKDGGTLICGDPSAFSFDQFGESQEKQFEALFGVKRKKKGEYSTTFSYGGLSLQTSRSPFFNLQLAKNSTVIAKYKNGMPAIVSHRFGKGKAILFGTNPFTLQIAANNNWKKFFLRFHKKLGLKTKCKIWRFKFPERLIKPVPEESGMCLTNNNLLWRANTPLTHKNIDTKGTYSYSNTPDSISDQGGSTNIPFVKGDLTDRRAAPTAGNVECGKGKLNDWIVAFSGKENVSITFDFKKPYNLIRFNIWFSGFLPELELFASNDLKQWHKIGNKSYPPINAEKDVMNKVIEGDFGKLRYLKVSFKKSEKKFIISEVEVWQK